MAIDQVEMSTNPFDDDKLHEECGVFGLYGHPDSAAHVALGLSLIHISEPTRPY